MLTSKANAKNYTEDLFSEVQIHQFGGRTFEFVFDILFLRFAAQSLPLNVELITTVCSGRTGW